MGEIEVGENMLEFLALSSFNDLLEYNTWEFLCKILIDLSKQDPFMDAVSILYGLY